MNIAILGLGTIGSGVYELLKNNSDINVKKILDLRAWMDNMVTDIDDIVSDDEIELVVETMGGLHPVREYALKCLNAGKSYISANKLLISECAHELQQAADNSGAALMFSASCGGGIAYLYNLIKTKRTDNIVSVGGILNGTTNYILDNVFSNGKSYDTALKAAQDLGYAERDPSSDVDGLDTLRKLILSCACGYGALLSKDNIPCYGIRNLADCDVEYAKARGGVIRLAAGGVKTANGVHAYVVPKLVKADSPEAAIRSNINYAYYRGENIGEFAFSGQGAGKFPTANNIIRDIYAVIEGDKRMFPAELKDAEPDNSVKHSFYVRLPKAQSDRMSFKASSYESGDYSIFETPSISFGELKQALDGADDYFVMILED